MFKAICKWPNGDCQSKDFGSKSDALDWAIRIKAWCMRRSLPVPEAEVVFVN